MRIEFIITSNKTRRYELDVSPKSNIKDIKKKLSLIFQNDQYIDEQFRFHGEVMEDYLDLDDYGVKENDAIFVGKIYQAGGPENSEYTTNINCMNKRGNNGRCYYYRIKGSDEGTVWGDHIYTDDSNIAKAAVLEGKCKIGEEKDIRIKIIESKSSYSSCNRNGVSSIPYGYWYGSYIFD